MVAGVINRVVEVVFAFPALLLALLLVAIAGPSALDPDRRRRARHRARLRPHGARAGARRRRTPATSRPPSRSGTRRARIVRAHILPNAMRPLVAIFALSVGQSIVWASSLAFLGLGVAPPSPEWGALLDAGRARSSCRPGGWSCMPGLVIVRARPGRDHARPAPAAPAWRRESSEHYRSREARTSSRRPRLGGHALRVRDLRVALRPRRVRRDVVRGVAFDLRAGAVRGHRRRVGLGQERHRAHPGRLAGRGADVEADELSSTATDVRELRRPRSGAECAGREVGFILQDALVSLDPLRPVGRRDRRGAAAARLGRPRGPRRKVVELLRAVGVPEPEVRARQRPDELSGGLRQRALIASAIALDPELVIADEPTTALDVTVQAQVLALLEQMKARGAAIILISHDLSVVAQLADQIPVMRDGEIVEQGRPPSCCSATPARLHPGAARRVPGARTRGHPL